MDVDLKTVYAGTPASESATLLSATSPAVAAAMAADQSVGAQVGQDVHQELGGDALGLGQVLGLDQDTGRHRGQLGHGTDGVLRFRRHPHEADSATTGGRLGPLIVAGFARHSGGAAGRLPDRVAGVAQCGPGLVHDAGDGPTERTGPSRGRLLLGLHATGARGVALQARLLQSARPLSLPSVDVGSGLVQAPQ